MSPQQRALQTSARALTLMLCCALLDQPAIASPLDRWAPSLSVDSSALLAPPRSEESRREIPWRPVESSQLAPLNISGGVTHSFGAHRLDISARLARRQLYQNSALASLYRDAEPDVTLGEISTTLSLDPTTRLWALTLGRFSHAVTPDRALNRSTLGELTHAHTASSQALHTPLWRLGGRGWSQVTSPQSQWRLGVSLSWRSLATASSTASSTASVIAARLSVSVPHEQLASLSTERGALIEWWSGYASSGIALEAQLTLATHMTPSSGALDWARRQLGVAQTLQRVTLSVEPRRALWGYASAHKRLAVTWSERYGVWAYLGAQARHTDESDLSPLEVAALAESRLTGVGLSSWAGLYLKERARGGWLPNRIGVTYAYVDPHVDFAYDARSRLRASLMYERDLTWLTLIAELWYTHQWSAPENRWRLDSDLAGVTIGAQL